MRKRSVAVFLCAVIVVAFGAYLLTVNQSSPTQAKIGIFYYVWYDTTSPESWNKTKIVDTPVLGDYDSCNSTVIKHHLGLIQNLSIDFVIISWWGFYDDYGKFTDNATKQLFQTAQSINSTLKFAIMVEPFPLNSSSYDYNGIYNHIYENFVKPYSPFYYNDSKPVICFFNNQNLTDNGSIPVDERFNTILVGQQNYTQWIYMDLNPYDYRDLGQNQISVTPRYDESNLSDRPGHVVVDSDLTQGVYDREWKNAIQLFRNGSVNTILISTWNEFPERTAIEPHHDATAVNQSTDFLYGKTKYYIAQIRHPTSPSLLPIYLFVGITVTSIVIAITINQFYIAKKTTSEFKTNLKNKKEKKGWVFSRAFRPYRPCLPYHPFLLVASGAFCRRL